MKINYKEKRIMSLEESESQDIEFMVEDAKLQFQKDLLETKKALGVCQLTLKELETDYPLNVQAIIDKQLDIEAYEDAIQRMEKLSEKLGFNS